MIDYSKFLKENLGDALKEFPADQQVDVNRMVQKLSKAMDEATKGETMEERHRNKQKSIDKVLTIEREYNAKYVDNSNK